MRRMTSGSMTVFFSMIMVAIVTFMVILYILEQMFCIQIQSRKMLDLCASSTLAGYNNALHERYGLFAIENEAVAEDDFEFFAELNFSAYELDGISLSSTASLSDLDVYEDQIMDFMEYRMISTIVSQYTGLLDSLDETEDDSDAIKTGLSVAEETETYCSLFSSFVLDLDGIDGSGTVEEEYVNNFWNTLWDEDAYRDMLSGLRGSEDTYEQTLSLWCGHVDDYIDIGEQALDAWEDLTEEGARIEPVLEELLDETESESLQEEIREILEGLHTGSGQDQDIQEALESNIEILKTARKGLKDLIENPDDEDALEQAEALSDYDGQISIEYTVSSASETKKSWTKLWNELQDYVTDLSAYIDSDTDIDADAFDTLPSQSVSTGSSLSSLSLIELSGEMADELAEVTGVILMKAADIEYLNGMFWNLSEIIAEDEGEEIVSSLTGDEKIRGYLSAEMEYAIAGNANDLENAQIVRLEIIGIRMLSNIYFLMTDTEMKAAIESMSALGGVLAPGFGDSLMKAIIVAVWAGLESIADYEALIEGGSVPLLKDHDSWKTDLDGLTEALSEGISTEMENDDDEEGIQYQDYLKILLLLVPQKIVELRTMDLIQLNLCKSEGSDLLLEDMVTAFSVSGSFSANGRSYTMEGTYSYE